jgi:predicted permease
MTWWQRLFRREALESQLDAELRDHVDRHTADLVASGLTEDEARRQALLEFGGVEGIKEACRDARGTRWLEDAVTDVRYALRLLRRAPGFATVAILSLALGLGANIAVGSLLDAVVLKTLPVRAPHDLVLLGERAPDRQTFSWSRTQFRDLGTSATLSGLCAFRPQMEFSVSGPTGVDVVKGQLFSSQCFEVIGVRAALGRTLTPADDQAGDAQPAAVIGYGFWQRYFGGDPAAIGTTVQLKGRPFIVVGVTPREFVGLEPGQPLDITIPLAHAPLVLGERLTASPTVRWLRLIGRLAPGVTRDRAAADLERIWRQARSPRAGESESRLEVLPGAQGLNDLRRQFSAPLRILAAGVGLLLIVACANLAGLMLARARARDHEIRLRVALGAGRGRIVRQLLTESLLLSVLGGAVGFGLAVWGSQAIVVLLSRGRSPIALPPMIDARLLIFAVSLTAVTSVLFGVWPAISAARQGSLAAGAIRTATRPGRLRAGALIGAQTAVAAILLTGAVLFAHSLARLHSVDLGFDKRNVLLARLQPGVPGERIRTRTVYRDLFVRLSETRNVRSVSMAMDLPLGGGLSYTAGVAVPPAKAGEDVAGFNFVGPRFCETMGIPILSGRDLTLADDERARPVAIVSASLAARYFPGRSAVGEHLDANNTIVEIIGVAGDVPYTSLRSAKELMVYRPYLQDAAGAAGLTFAVRTHLAPAAAADLVRSALRDVAPAVPFSSLSTLDARVDGSIPSERLLANISSFFGMMAVLLVGIGVYGTLAYSLAQRTREFGVRRALGATGGDITRTVLTGALAPVCAGLLVGVPLTFAAARVATTSLFGITPGDPVAYAAALTVLLTAALTAAALPTRRAVLADPIAALREE